MPSLGLWRAHAAYATETAYGTAVAVPTAYIPAMAYDSYDDDQGIVIDEAGRGVLTKALAVYSGMHQGKFAFTHPFFPNQCSRFFSKMLGQDVIASSSNGAWQHAITANSSSTPSSDTVFSFFGSTAFEARFAGVQYEALDFKFSRASGLASIKVSGKGFAPSTSLGEQSPTYTSDPSLRGWQCVFSLAGSTRLTLLDFEMNAKRDVELVFAANNSQNPAAAEMGYMDVGGKMKIYGSTEEPVIDYHALTQQTMDLLFSEGTAGSTQNRLDLSFGKVAFTKVVPDFGHAKFLVYDVEWRAIHNATDSGPMTVNITVATSSAYI